MLVPIVFVLAFLLALTGALLDNSARAVAIAHGAEVARYSDAAIADGVADFTAGLGAFVAAHGPDGPWPTATAASAPRSACAPAAGTGCAFTYVIRGTITNASAPGDAAAGDAAPNLQSSVIDEQRVSAVVSIELRGPAATVATRTRFLTYRVFATAPYAIVSGSRDIATVNGSAAAAQGDSGGAAGTGSADTRIHVRLSCRTVTPDVVPLVNDQQAPGNDGLPWGNAAGAAYEAPCTIPDAPADAFRSEHWQNGDTNTSGWTQ
jgi:hypothetical protein